MPIYEYHCNRCGHNFEAMQSFNENPIHLCPNCNGVDVNRLVSAPSFHLKGTGWYVTDFKEKQKTTDNQAEKVKDKGDGDETGKDVNKKDTNKSTDTAAQDGGS